VSVHVNTGGRQEGRVASGAIEFGMDGVVFYENCEAVLSGDAPWTFETVAARRPETVRSLRSWIMRTFAPHVALACVALVALTGPAPAANRTLVVAADGSGAFASVQEAVTAARNPTEKDPVDIVIKPGVYHGMATTRDWVNLVGEDRDKCALVYSRKPEEKTYRTHVIWATTNSVIKNLTLVGKDVKYCIHSDGGRAFALRVENCVLRREYPKGRRGYRAGFGVGLRADQHIIMRDCVVDADQPIYMHNWNDQRSSCSMTIEKSALNGKDYAISIYLLGSRQRDFFVVHDSRLVGAKAAILYKNHNRPTPPMWKGASEIELYGSGNTMTSPIQGAEMKDDAEKRLSGLERARKYGTHRSLAEAGARIQEDYGTLQGKTRKPKAWRPTPADKKYGVKTEFTDDALVLTCPADNKLFGVVGGPGGRLAAMPLTFELRMRCSYGPGGLAELYYCAAPNAWRIHWRADRVFDVHNRASAIEVDTRQWQTYRIVARSPKDVRLFVVGSDGPGIQLKPGKHSARYFQFRVHKPGTKAEIASTLLSGDIPKEQPRPKAP